MSKLKKFLLISLSICFLLTCWTALKIFEQLQYDKVFPKANNVTVNLTDNVSHVLSSKFVNDIQVQAEKSKASLFKIMYEPDKKFKKPKIKYYVYDFDENSFYKNLPLKWGRKLENNQDRGKFLSNQNTENPNQIGQIDILYNNSIIEIHPMIDIVNCSTDGNFILTTDNEKIASGFTDSLVKIHSYNCSVNTFGISAKLSPDFYSYLWFIGLIFCLAILTLITYIYMVVLRYKEFGIKRLFGSSNTNIINSLITDECLPATLIAAVISFIGILLYVWFYSNFLGFKYFISYLIKIETIGVLSCTFIFYIFTQCIRAFKLNSVVLKGKKSPAIIKVINTVTEIMFLVIAVIVCSTAIDKTSLMSSQILNMQKLESTKDYASIGVSYNMEDIVPMYKAQKKIENLYNMLNENGGMLFTASSFYRHQDYLPTSSNYKLKAKLPDYYPDKYMVSVNNEYLKSNPIYDCNGNKINLQNENTNYLNVLVPEKYKTHEKDIHNQYSKFHTLWFYFMEDHYKDATGQIDMGEDTKKYILEHHELLPVKIIFVNNNQNYYSYLPWIVPETNNIIKDPVAVVVNNKNTGCFLKSEYLGNGFFWGKGDYYNPAKSLNKYIEKADIGNHVINISPVYDAVSQSVKETKGKLYVLITMFIISAAVIVLVSIFSTVNYMQDNRQKIVVLRLHGFSFFPLHKSLIISQLCIWAVTALSLFFLSNYPQINSKWNFCILPIMFLIQAITTVLTVKIKEPQKNSETLKGA